MTFDLPLPLGPTTDENDEWKGPIICSPAYDLKFVRISLLITNLGESSALESFDKGRAGGSVAFLGVDTSISVSEKLSLSCCFSSICELVLDSMISPF